MTLALKICGMRDPRNIAEVAALAPDYMGFIFYDRSPRYVGMLSPGILRSLPDSVQKVGVFVNPSVEHAESTIERYGLDLVQLHGDETVEVCRAIRKKCPVTKAFRLRQNADLSVVGTYADACDYFLFDTPTENFGGSGSRFDWTLLERFESPLPFFLSGGIGPDDVAQVRAFCHPALKVVDVNSRFEIEPGLKNVTSLAKFIHDLNSR